MQLNIYFRIHRAGSLSRTVTDYKEINVLEPERNNLLMTTYLCSTTVNADVDALIRRLQNGIKFKMREISEEIFALKDNNHKTRAVK